MGACLESSDIEWRPTWTRSQTFPARLGLDALDLLAFVVLPN